MRPRRIWSNESGASVVEHAILSCVVGLVIASAVASGLSPREMLAKIAFIAFTVAGCEHETTIECDPNSVE